MAEARKHRRVWIRETPGDLPRRHEARSHIRISLEQTRQCVEHPQPRLLDAVVAALLQQAASSGDPAHRRSQVAAEEQPERLPKCAARCARRVTAMQPHLVSGEPRVLARVVSPDHVCGNGQALEILDIEMSVTTSGRQLVERLTPHPTFKRTTCTLFPIRNGHRWTIRRDANSRIGARGRVRSATTAARMMRRLVIIKLGQEPDVGVAVHD